MNKWGLMLLIGTCLLLAACQTDAPPATPTPEATLSVAEAGSDRCGDRSKLALEIFIYNWTEYLDPDIRDQFEAECGVKVTEVYFASNEELLASLQSGAASYDIIVPSDYMIQTLIGEDFLEPLDFSAIPNISHYDAAFTHRYFDPEQRYNVPYFWGTTAIAVDASAVSEIDPSWSLLFDPAPETCGKITMLDDQREVISAALMYLGYSVNDTDPAHLEKVKDLLIQQAKCVKAYDSETPEDLLVQGETVAGHMWSGDYLLASGEGGRDTIEYVIPQEGNVIYQEGLAVPKSAQNKYTAMVFINYLADPEIAAQNAEYVGYGTTNDAARAFIDPELLANPAIYPPQEQIDKMQWIEDVGEALGLYDRIWTEFKAAISGG